MLPNGDHDHDEPENRTSDGEDGTINPTKMDRAIASLRLAIAAEEALQQIIEEAAREIEAERRGKPSASP